MLQQLKLNHPVYDDGILEYGEISTIYDSAKRKIGEGFNVLEKLMYKEMSVRDQDYVTANSLGYTLDLKIKVPKRNLSSKKKVKISDLIYDIYKIDFDDINTYIYLQVVKK